jgi:uncharacterized protein YqeY
MVITELQKDQISALKNKETFRLGVIRYLLAQIKNREIELRPQHLEMNDEEVIRVLKKQNKKRTQAIEEFQKAGRQDLVDKETSELEIIKEYLNRFEPNA